MQSSVAAVQKDLTSTEYKYIFLFLYSSFGYK